MTQRPTLHDRLMVRYGNQKKEEDRLKIPEIGRIDSETVALVQELAVRARNGDNTARDQLFWALRPRLNRKSWFLKSWPNTAGMTGIWDRDDVRQETWLVFVDLLTAWDGKTKFVPYLLARFGWRLRDRILRGIGKRQNQFGEIRVSEEMLDELVIASDGEQPESVALARRLLEVLLKQSMKGDTPVGEFEAWRELINSEEMSVLVSPDLVLVEEEGKQSRVA